MVAPEVFAIRPRIPASWRIWAFEPRAPESAIMKMGVELVHRGGLGLGDGVGGVVPDADNPVLPLRFGEQAALVLAVDLEGRLFGVGDQLLLLFRDGRVGDGDGDARLGRILVALGLDPVEDLTGAGGAVDADAAVDDLAELLLADLELDFQLELVFGDRAVDEPEVLGDRGR